MQQLRKQLPGRERCEIACVKYTHQSWLKAAQTSCFLACRSKAQVPAACHHPACILLLAGMHLQQHTSRQRRFSGWAAWQGAKGRAGVEEDKPVMLLSCGTEAGLRFPPRAQIYLGRVLISAQPHIHSGKGPLLLGALGPSWQCRQHSSSALD